MIFETFLVSFKFWTKKNWILQFWINYKFVNISANYNRSNKKNWIKIGSEMTEIIINLRFHEIFHSKKTIIGDMHAQCFRNLLFIIHWFDISLQTQTDEDGKTSLEFSIEASEQKFTLHCPSHYPNYGNDDNFFVEADSGLQMWCNALNEYLLDTDGQLSLSAILDKGLSLYSAADARSRSREVSMSSTFNDDDEDVSYSYLFTFLVVFLQFLPL